MLNKNTDNIHSKIEQPNIIFLTPKFGININPAKNVPKILPIVDNEDIFPDVVPIWSILLFFIFTAIGDTVASKKLGIPKVTVAHIIATKIKLFESCDNTSINITSSIGIILVAIADINKIYLEPEIAIFKIITEIKKCL